MDEPRTEAGRALLADSFTIAGPRAIIEVSPEYLNDRILAIEAEARADSLDAAWAEAEAALPEGSWLTVKRQSPVAYLVETGTGYGTSLSIRWQAAADTPAAALRALAAKLRG